MTRRRLFAWVVAVAMALSTGVPAARGAPSGYAIVAHPTARVDGLDRVALAQLLHG